MFGNTCFKTPVTEIQFHKIIILTNLPLDKKSPPWYNKVYQKRGHTMFTLTLDRGHYGKYNHGAIDGYYESERMWLLGEYLTRYLEAEGVTVKPTRTDPDKDLAVYKRGQLSANTDFFLSLHTNGCSTASVDRVCGIYQVSNPCSQSFTLSLANAVARCMGINTVKTYEKSNALGTDYYGVLRGAASVGTDGCIIEHSFHTNPSACQWLMSDENLDYLAQVEAQTIVEQLHRLYPERFIKGDVDGDGKVTIKDYTLAKRSALHYCNLTLSQIYRGDTDGDNRISQTDVDNIKQIILKGE